MRILLLSLAAFTIPIFAQFSSLVTTGDGADLYFSSTLPLKGSGLPHQGRIYKVGSAPLTVVADVPQIGPANPCMSLLCVSNAYNLFQVDVSRDGSILAYNETADCVGHCINNDYHETTVKGVPGTKDLVYDGQGRLSGNGRYFVYYVIFPYAGYSEFDRVDLTTGETLRLPPIHGSSYVIGSGRVVSDNGDFLATINGQLNVFRNGQWIPVPRPEDAPNFGFAAIDAGGESIVYEACCLDASIFPPKPGLPTHSELLIFHPDTGENSVFFRGSAGAYYPAFSADGAQVAFVTTMDPGAAKASGQPQVYLANVDGTALRAITDDPDGVTSFTLSDDGETVWYLTRSRAVYKLSSATGEAQQKIPSTCSATLYDDISPGSAAFFSGGCLGESFNAKFGGIPGPFVSQIESGIWVQVPWDVQGPTTVAISFDSDSPFETFNGTAKVLATVPRFVSSPIHQDWSGYVNTLSPARPNEIIHIYATGLGPVQPMVATGTAAPSDPASKVVMPFECNLPVIFAGLAPGLVGFYQVSFKMPQDVQTVIVSCAGGLGVRVAMQP